jgi:hypothetical protein
MELVAADVARPPSAHGGKKGSRAGAVLEPPGFLVGPRLQSANGLSGLPPYRRASAATRCASRNTPNRGGAGVSRPIHPRRWPVPRRDVCFHRPVRVR